MLCPSQTSSLSISPRANPPGPCSHHPSVTLPCKRYCQKPQARPAMPHATLDPPSTRTGASNRHKTFCAHPTHSADFVTCSQAVQLYWPTAHPNTSYTLAFTARSSSTAAYATQCRPPALMFPACLSAIFRPTTCVWYSSALWHICGEMPLLP